MNNLSKNIALWSILGLLVLAALNVFQGAGQKNPQLDLSYNDLIELASGNQIEEVLVRGFVVSGRLKDSKQFTFHIPPQVSGLVDRLAEKGIRVKTAPPEEASPSFLQILISWFPVLLLIGAWIFLMRHMQSGNGKAMGFGKSRARLLNEKSGRITFEDVAGVDEAKQELEEIVDFLKDPQKFQRLGGKIPKGVLLVGPPGTGKTLLARAIAGEANVPFFTISGSDFVEMFVGVGASRVRDMFEQAKKNAPCIVFVDEIDAVGRHRGIGMGGGNDEREQTLNQLLVEMDGFEANEGVILIAATNRPDVLDPALLRPGRFDRQVTVPYPDVAGRAKILQVHIRKVPLSTSVDVSVIARGTPGFSGADLANLINEAALLAARHNKRVVSMVEIEEAKDKVMMGAERRSMAMTEKEKEMTAYHEAGHALVAALTPVSDPIHKATIVPRGRALGMVVRLPEGDRVSMSRAKLKGDMVVALAGRLAEEIIFGEDNVTTGASQDFKMATRIARKMVTEWGMSPKLGTIAYSEEQGDAFMGHGSQGSHLSEETTRQIDVEIRTLVDEAYTKARQLLTTHHQALHDIAQGLLELETLTGEEIGQIVQGKPLNRSRDTEAKASSPKKRGTVPSSEEVKPAPRRRAKKEEK